MASKSSPTTPMNFRKPRYKPMSLDPLSRVIHTQTLTALKPLRNAKLADPKAARIAVYRENRGQLTTLCSTIDAADTDELSDQQRLALNMGKFAALLSRRLLAPLVKDAPDLLAHSTSRKRRPVAATAPEPPKKIKEEPLDDDEPCCSATAVSTNETLYSLLDAQLRSACEAAPIRRPATASRPVVVERAAPGAAPVKVVVANRNGAAARVVAVRRPTTAQPITTAVPARPAPTRPTESAPSATVVIATRPFVILPQAAPAVPATTLVAVKRPTVYSPSVSISNADRIPVVRSTVPSELRAAVPNEFETAQPIVPREKHSNGHLCRRLRIHKDAGYGCCEADKPEKYPANACPFCGLVTEGASRIEHVRETHPDRFSEFAPFVCILRECDYRTTSRQGVWMHSIKVHSHLYDRWEMQGRLTFDKNTVCPLCDKPYPLTSIRQLRMHVKDTHDTMPAILCGSCCETCTSTSDLFLHWVHSPFCDGKAKLLDCKQESFLALFT